MNDSISQRLAEFQGKWVKADSLKNYYGIDLRSSEQGPLSDLRGRLQYWSSIKWPNHPGPRHNPVRDEKSESEAWDRTVLELFLQDQRLLPWKWAAASVGMDEPSLRRVIGALDSAGWRVPVTDQSGLLVRRDLPLLLRENVPGLQNQTFGDHSQRSRAIQDALAHQFSGLSIQPLHCVTSTFLREPEIEFASQFDVLTDEPIGLRHVVWLDLDKPAALSPDAVSTLTYLDHETELHPLAMPVRADPELESVRERLRRGA